MQQTVITTADLAMAAILLIPMACLPAYIAKKKGYNFILWYIYAFSFFMLAFIHSLLIPPKAKRVATNNGENVNVKEFKLPEEMIINKRRINYCFIGCPLDTLSYVVLSKPYQKKLVLRLNLYAEKPIKAFDLKVTLKDTMNGVITVKEYSNVSYSDTVDFDITEHIYCMNADFSVERVYLANGEEWASCGEPLEYEIEVLDGTELEKLRTLTNKSAVCLPYEEKDYWVCSCSKANNTDTCVLCGITKEDLFTKADKDTVRSLKNDLIRRNNLTKFNIARLSKEV